MGRKDAPYIQKQILCCIIENSMPFFVDERSTQNPTGVTNLGDILLDPKNKQDKFSFIERILLINTVFLASFSS